MSLDYKEIGRRIRKKRLVKKISQQELAGMVGVSSPHISNIERGVTKVSLPVLMDIANALDATLDELVCDSLCKAETVYVKEIAQEIELCSPNELRIAVGVLKALIENLRKGRE